MKVLIAYDSKNGTAQKSAELLSKQIDGADQIDLKKEIPDFEKYDLIVIGGSIRMGQYPRLLKKTLKKYAHCFLKKNMIYFINCGFPENREQYFCDNIAQVLRDRTLGCFCFGGELDLTKLKGTDRMAATAMIRQAQGSGRPPLLIDERAIKQCGERILAFAENMNQNN